MVAWPPQPARQDWASRPSSPWIVPSHCRHSDINHRVIAQQSRRLCMCFEICWTSERLSTHNNLTARICTLAVSALYSSLLSVHSTRRIHLGFWSHLISGNTRSWVSPTYEVIACLSLGRPASKNYCIPESADTMSETALRTFGDVM